MKNSEVYSKLEGLKLVPVVAIEDAADAAHLAEALVQGGLPCAEVTFRTAAAASALKNMKEATDIFLGAGTVLSVEQVDCAMENGAEFIVSPGLNPKVVSYCVENGICIIPGCSNPTDLEMALDLGIDVVKFFPAEAFGGVATLKAISAPYKMLRFVPTGGINLSNIQSYLEFDKIIACGGSWMVKKELITNKQFTEITRLTKEAVTSVNK